MINILLFAQLKDQAKTERIVLDKELITVKELLDELKVTYSFTSLEHILVAINEEYAEEGDIVRAGDTVALIPPVSGG